MMGLTIFAERMKAAREAKGMKQNELARIIGVTPTTISSYEKSDTEGNGKKPTLENAVAIAKALDCSLDWLSGMVEQREHLITDFSIEDYLRSLVIVLLEISSHYDTETNSIKLKDSFTKYFARRINDLIKIYHNGTLDEDFFDVCVDKAIKDAQGYRILGNNIIPAYLYNEVWDKAAGIVCALDGIPSGLFHTCADDMLNDTNDVTIMLNARLIEAMKEDGRKKGEYYLKDDTSVSD